MWRFWRRTKAAIDEIPGGTVTSELGLDKSTTVSAALQQSVVWRCCEIIAGNIASLPLFVYRRTSDGREAATDHPVYRLLHDAPNRWMTSFVWREQMLMHLLLAGNHYAVIRRGGGRVTAIEPVAPDRVTVRKTGDVVAYDVHSDERGTERVPAQNMIHIPGMGWNGVQGISVIQAVACNAISLAEALENHQLKTHENGAAPTGQVVMQQALKPEGLRALRQAFERLYSGKTNTGRVVFLDKGMEFRPISISPEDAQTLQSRKFQIEDISRIFGVPLPLLNSTEKSTSWGSGIEEQVLGFLQFTLRPWLSRIEQELNRKLFSSQFYCEFELNALLRGDSKSRAELYSSALQNGWMSVNEVRRLENLPPIDGGDQHFNQTNLQPLTGERE